LTGLGGSIGGGFGIEISGTLNDFSFTSDNTSGFTSGVISGAASGLISTFGSAFGSGSISTDCSYNLGFENVDDLHVTDCNKVQILYYVNDFIGILFCPRALFLTSVQ